MCPPGTYYSAASTSCVVVSAGYYAAVSGLTAASNCTSAVNAGAASCLSTEAYVSYISGGASTSTDADGVGTNVYWANLFSIALDSHGFAYVVDVTLHTVRRISLTSPCKIMFRLLFNSFVVMGVTVFENIADPTNTLAGQYKVSGGANGMGTQASFSYPASIFVDTNRLIYVTDSYGIRKITKSGRNSNDFPDDVIASIGNIYHARPFNRAVDDCPRIIKHGSGVYPISIARRRLAS
jgi:hypothetical protein